MLHPYESPIEVIFGDVESTIEAQIELSTPWATFRADFLLARPGGRRVVVECDGREFHDYFRDEFRDGLILGEGLVDSIFRIQGTELWNDQGCTFAIAELTRAEPTLFDERSTDAIQRLARAESGLTYEEYQRYLGGVSSRYRSQQSKEKRSHWKELYAWALNQGPMSFQELLRRRIGGLSNV